MKICIIAPNFREPTAWMISAYKTAINLAKQKNVEVVVITTKTKGSLAYEVIEGVRVYRLPCFYFPDPVNTAVVPFMGIRLYNIIKKEKPDKFIVNKYMFYTSLSVFWLKLFGKRVVMQTDTYPGYVWFAPSKLLNAVMWVYTRTIGYLVLRLSDKVIILHEGLIEPTKRLHIKKFKVVHNGVDLTKVDSAKPAKDLVKYKGGKLLVTYMGRLDDVKGYKLLLEAIKNVHNKVDARFVFICGDKYPELRKKLQKEYPYIKFIGFRNDVEAVWIATDINVLPSYTEGLPNSVLEAMSCNVAVIATRVGAIPYIIKDKKNGLLIDIDSKDIEKKLLLLLRNKVLLNKIKQNSRKVIEDEFDWSKIASKLIKEL